jgi:FkbM family methyltransferase
MHLKKRVPKSVRSALKKFLYLRRYKVIIEHMEFDFLASRLFHQKTIRFLDVGAHTGEFLDIFKNANHKHKYYVVAIEPLPSNLAKLRKKARVFKLSGLGKVKVLPFAIGEKRVTRFYLGNETTLFTSNQDWVRKFPESFSKVRELEIQTRSLSFLRDNNPRVLMDFFDIVKIDTEGSDLEVLCNLLDSRIEFNSLIIEFSISTSTGIIEKLQLADFNEIYAFVRRGIETVYIGNVLNDRTLEYLVTQDGVASGNLVAVKSRLYKNPAAQL